MYVRGHRPRVACMRDFIISTIHNAQILCPRGCVHADCAFQELNMQLYGGLVGGYGRIAYVFSLCTWTPPQQQKMEYTLETPIGTSVITLRRVVLAKAYVSLGLIDPA